ncbi:MAG: altronate hydrolase [Cytophagaceae bacterium SCN 52-12]|nr:MAG: altronate hydrolase [Cytophagaceae bacterium SCN 52-12]
MEKLLRIHRDDNVLVVKRLIGAGEMMRFDGEELVYEYPIGLGHKIAAEFIPKGGKVIKFGIPIGSATEDIPRGAHVHLHNLKSDYLPTFTLDHEFIGKK